MIYLDNNATTFLDPEVASLIEELTKLQMGNPSSMHSYGQKARQLLVEARRNIASYLGVYPDELCFTSSATEAINLLLSCAKRPRHLISSKLEHPATLAALKRLELQGSSVTYLTPLEGKGAITAAQVESAIGNETDLIMLMAANNETGIKSDMQGIAALAEREGIAFISDYVALFGKEPVVFPSALSGFCLTGHKIHGPKGVALAVIKRGYKVDPLIVGGPQQFKRRAGTEDVVGIVAFAKAVELALEDHTKKITQLRNGFEQTIKEGLSDVVVHGEREMRVPHVSNLSFVGVDAESLVIKLDLAKVAVSHGAACGSGGLEHSHVLLNMGLGKEVVLSSIRFSLSRFTTQEEIERAATLVLEMIGREALLAPLG